MSGRDVWTLDSVENPILRYCAWAVSRNFLASNNVGTGGQEARLLSHRYTHSLDKVPDANLAGLCFCGSAKREMPGKLAYISIMSSVSYQGNPPPIFLITLIKSCPHWRVVFFFFFRSEISPPPRFFFFCFLVFWDIWVIFYWFVHHIEGDNGQDIRHTLILGFSLLFRLLSFGYACPLCVLAKGETLLHRACKRNQVETVFKILALPGTDVNVQGKVFLALPRLLP